MLYSRFDGTRQQRVFFIAFSVSIALSLFGCGDSRPVNAAATAAAPASVDTSASHFTCLGVADESVKAVFPDVSLRDSSGRYSDGGYRRLDCSGEVRANGSADTTVFESLISRKSSAKSRENAYRGPGSERFNVQGAEGASGDVRVMENDRGVSSLITCGDAFVMVTLYADVAPMNGDIKKNAKNLALSMVPWTCNGEVIPGLGQPLSPSLVGESDSPSGSTATST